MSAIHDEDDYLNDAEIIAQQWADDYVGRRRNPDDTLDDDPMAGMMAWLASLDETEEPIRYCPDPDLHRGLFLARETTWREPAAIVRAELAAASCCWCGGVKAEYRKGEP